MVGQEYKGQTNGFNNGDNLNYTDWKVGVTYALGRRLELRRVLHRHRTRRTPDYTLAGRNIGKATGTVFVQKTF